MNMEQSSLALVPYTLNNPFGDVLTLSERIFSVAPTADSSIDIRISQQYKPDGKGGTSLGFGASVYHCAVVLGKFVEMHTDLYDLKHKQVLELGCGTGFLSVLCSVLGAKFVLATDGDEGSVELSRQNFLANSAALSGAYRCSRLLW
ncbi:hypothetical protein EON63_09705 [archaeon]|nr:MAG: hypothetical protein EON63_09705 [archaeon]